MPRVPDHSLAPKLEYSTKIEPLTSCGPLIKLLRVNTLTSFSHIKICFSISKIPPQLRPFLVLFQECLFQSPVAGPNGTTEWTDVVKKTAQLLISHEASVGLGNEIFSTGWLHECLVLGGVCLDEDLSDMLHHLLDVFANTKFDKDRITSICKNLKSDLVEGKRGGRAMLSAVCGRITSAPGGIERAIGIFTQEQFLTDCLDDLDNVIKQLDALKEAIISNCSETGGFAVHGGPLDGHSSVGSILQEAWESKVLYPRGKAHVSGMANSPFPFPREPFAAGMVDAEIGSTVYVGISGLQAFYLSQFVACDVLNNPRDLLAVSLMCELLSRMEGPLFSGVRGNGLAYGCSTGISIWQGALEVSISRSSEPRKALLVFYDICEYLATSEGFDDLCSDFNIDTARSMVAYNRCAGKSTAGGIIADVLRSTLRGSFEEDQVERLLKDINKEDLKRVFDTYFTRFFDPKEFAL